MGSDGFVRGQAESYGRGRSGSVILGRQSDEVMTRMARVVVIGDLMTDTVALARLALARGSDTPAAVTMHGGGSGANIAAWLAADGGDVAFVGRRGWRRTGRGGRPGGGRRRPRTWPGCWPERGGRC